MKRAFITGITGQDGSFLAELLLDKGYHVVGLVRGVEWDRGPNVASLVNRIEVVEGDFSSISDMADMIAAVAPDEIYNLASQSRPGESWARAAETLAVNGMAAVRLFEAVRAGRPACRVYHASSSEMFGRAPIAPQDESTPFNPVNPYAAAKVYAHQMARIYRDSFGLFISSGILFNHESERRPLHFLTQKVAYGAACASLGITESEERNELGRPIVEGGKLALGNLDICKDWGYAADFVHAMWLMLQQAQPDEYVIGTGVLHSLRDLCELAYGSVGLDWRDCIVSDPRLVRPLESGKTLADPSKARTELGWEPTVSFDAMVRKMVDNQVARLEAKQGKEFFSTSRVVR
jgi:GDPmannose 4,6-dehydratase